MYNVVDKVILNGKETEITEVAYDGNGGKMYGVKGSLNYHYASELEEAMKIETKYEIGDHIWVVYKHEGEVYVYDDQIVNIVINEDKELIIRLINVMKSFMKMKLFHMKI